MTEDNLYCRMCSYNTYPNHANKPNTDPLGSYYITLWEVTVSVHRTQARNLLSLGLSSSIWWIKLFLCVCANGFFLSQLDRGLSHVTARRIPVLEANHLDCINYSQWDWKTRIANTCQLTCHPTRIIHLFPNLKSFY